MKYCTSFRQSPYTKQFVDEIRYPFSLLGNVLEELQNDYERNYIVEIKDITHTDLSLEQIHDLAVAYSNLFFDFYKFEDFKTFAEECSERKYMYHYPVNTYMDIQYLLQFQGLAAITIEEPLTFDLPQVSQTIKYDEERDIQIRVWPTVGRPSRYIGYKGDNGINHFWILPQHMYLYEPYIDVVEIIDKNQSRERALCEVYLSDTPYVLGLYPLIKYMDSTIIGNFIDPKWIEQRLNCKQICLRNGTTCHRCMHEDKMYEFCKTHPELINKYIQYIKADMSQEPNKDLIVAKNDLKDN